MSRNRFEQIWLWLHFNNIELLQQSTNRLFKIQPLWDFFLEIFQTIHKPNQHLCLDEAMIPWRGRLRIRTYNPGKCPVLILLRWADVLLCMLTVVYQNFKTAY